MLLLPCSTACVSSCQSRFHAPELHHIRAPWYQLGSWQHTLSLLLLLLLLHLHLHLLLLLLLLRQRAAP
jgi:hypothetical protein